MDQEKIRELERLVNQNYNNTAGITVRKDGMLLYETYFNTCNADSKIHVYSVTKSIISILIGIAIDKGYIKSVDQKVLDFFPDYKVKSGEKAIYEITLAHLLTMTAPYKYKYVPPYIKYFTSDDFVTFTLDLLGGRPAGKFNYTPLIGPDILSGVLTKAVKQPVLSFASEHLFTPLGITVGQNVYFHSKEEQLAFNEATNISGWAADQSGVNTAGWGLTLSPLDMSKIGQLYLNNGTWDGRQLVSENWISSSTQEHSRSKKARLAYGYLWWINPDSSYAAMGDGGNIIYVNPEKKMVVSIACLFQQRAKDRLRLIKEYIEPIFECEPSEPMVSKSN